jgi:EcsC protein family
MDKRDTDALRNAVRLLEHPSLAGRLSNMIGKPVELLGRALPAGASQAIATATTKSIEAALKVALLTIRGESQESSQLLHRTLAVASGAAGGAFGIISLPLELPVSTIIILRSILDIARSEGENLTDRESTLSCVEVLGIGGRAETDDAAKSDYFVVRGILAKSVKEASG